METGLSEHADPHAETHMPSAINGKFRGKETYLYTYPNSTSTDYTGRTVHSNSVTPVDIGQSSFLRHI
jgi:hypothetical protein